MGVFKILSFTYNWSNFELLSPWCKLKNSIKFLINVVRFPAVHLTIFWSGMCHPSFKNIPIPYTNFPKEYTRTSTNFAKQYTRTYTNYPLSKISLYLLSLWIVATFKSLLPRSSNFMFNSISRHMRNSVFVSFSTKYDFLEKVLKSSTGKV